MHRIDTPTAVNGRFVRIAPGYAAPTELSPEWCNAAQEETVTVIEHAGLQLDKGNNGQLLQALLEMFGAPPGFAVLESAENGTNPPNLYGLIEVGATKVVRLGFQSTLTWLDAFGHSAPQEGWYLQSVRVDGSIRTMLFPGARVGTPSAQIEYIQRESTQLKIGIHDSYDLSAHAVGNIAWLQGTPDAANSKVFAVTDVNPIAGDKYIRILYSDGVDQLAPGGTVDFFAHNKIPTVLPDFEFSEQKYAYYNALFPDERIGAYFHKDAAGNTTRHYAVSHMRELKVRRDSAFPGAVVSSAAAVPPDGWLECDGAELSRHEYPDLFDAIGETYGAGDGSTTFLIPDLRGEFVRGLDNGRGIDAARALGSFQDHQQQGHAHDISFNRGSGGSGVYTGFGEASGNNNAIDVTATDAIGPPKDDGTHGDPNIGHENRPRNIAMMYVIKY